MSMLNQNRDMQEETIGEISFLFLSLKMHDINARCKCGSTSSATTLHPHSASLASGCLFPFIYPQPTHDQPVPGWRQAPFAPTPLSSTGLESLVAHDMGEEGTQRGVELGLSRLTSGFSPPPSLCQMAHTGKWASPALEKGSSDFILSFPSPAY